LWVSKDEALAKARELLAEEKAGDEGLRLAEHDGILQEITNMGIIIMEGKAYVQQDRVLEIISRHPVSEQKAPCADRTEKLVKRLREISQRACIDGNGDLCVREDIENALRDFEKEEI
jgi:hypothetical protein